MIIFLYVLLAVFVIYFILALILGYLCFQKIINSPHRRDYFDEKYLKKRYIDGNFEKMKEYNDNNEYIEVNVKSDDDLNLYGRLLLRDNKKFVILVHGFGSIANRLLEYCQFYENLGFSVLLIDLRAHGKSEGNFIGMGVKDKDDVENFITYLKTNYGTDIQIILHGFSMGAVTTMNVIKDNDPCIKFAVEDCGFTRSYIEMKYKIRKDMHIPATPMYEFAYMFNVMITHNHYHKVQPIHSVKETKIPLLIIHGDKDDFVPVKHAYKINDNCASYHELLIVEGAPHTMSYKYDKEDYEEYVKRFIKKFIK